jgi:protein-disulfide isomerase
LTPCAKDAPAGSGCGTHGDAPAAPATKKVDDTVWKVVVGKDDPAKGARDPIVTLVVFSDFQCPFCRRGADVLAEVLAGLPDDVRLVWKDCPLPMHSEAEPAAEFARAARARFGDDGFWAVHGLLYQSQETLGDDTYKQIAAKIGLPWGPTLASMKAARFGAVIQAGVALSDKVDVPATPTTFVNGRKIVGAQPYEVVRAVVDEELTKANALVGKGVARKDVYSTLVSTGKEVSPPTDTPPVSPEE